MAGKNKNGIPKLDEASATLPKEPKPKTSRAAAEPVAPSPAPQQVQARPQNPFQEAHSRIKMAAGPTLLRVSSTSNPASVAGAIAGCIRETGECELQAIGAGAVNNAVKAIAIARGYVAPSGVNLMTIPAFIDIDMNGEERTAIKFQILSRH